MRVLSTGVLHIMYFHSLLSMDITPFVTTIDIRYETIVNIIIGMRCIRMNLKRENIIRPRYEYGLTVLTFSR